MMRYAQGLRLVLSPMTSDLEEFDSSSVPLLQANVGLGAALGLHSITTRVFLAPRVFLFTGLCSNVGPPADDTK